LCLPGSLQECLGHLSLHRLLRQTAFTVKIDILGQASTAVQRAHGHSTLEDEAVCTLARQQGDKLHLGAVPHFCFRAESQFTGSAASFALPVAACILSISIIYSMHG
jgi:hypothetical protein